MAIMGIAKFAGDIMEDTFLARLWKKQLWRDPLWSSYLSPYGGKLPRELKSIKMPSWSWAAVAGPVAYTWPG
jgi:hypothetical protein